MKQFRLKSYFVLLLTLIFLTTSGQNSLQKSVLFKKNKFSLSDDAKKILDGVKDSIGDFVIDKIIIKGYTDSDADSTYNAKLSQQRCQAVADYLSGAGIDKSKFYIAAFGEYFPIAENSNENNKSKNRRVDLIITMHNPAFVKKNPEKKDSCNGDTLIMVSDGVMMLVNKCNYLQKKNCIQLRVERKVEYKVKVNKFKMKLGFKRFTKFKKKRVVYFAHLQCPDSTCKDRNTIIYIPTYEVKEKKVTVENYDSATGEYSKLRVPKIKSLKKKSYAAIPYSCGDGDGGSLCMSICCGGILHCGCQQSKMKFKNGIKIIDASSYGGAEVSISSDSSVVSFNAENGLNSILLWVDGDTLRINDIQTSALNHGIFHMKSCKDKKWFLLMRIRVRCVYHKKYKFKRKDIELQIQKPWENDK